MAAGRAFRIRRQTDTGEHLGVPKTPSCKCCYRPLEQKNAAYCDERCHQNHQRLAGAP